MEENTREEDTTGSDSVNYPLVSSGNLDIDAIAAPHTGPVPTTPPPEGDARITQLLKDVPLPERRPTDTVSDIHLLEQLASDPQGEVPAQATPSSNEKPRVTSVHTLKDDLQSVVEEKKLSLVQIAALEQDKHSHDATYEATSIQHNEQRSRILRTFALGLGLLMLGGIVLVSVFTIMNERGSSAGERVRAEALLFSEQVIPFSIQKLSSTELKRLLKDARDSSGLTLGAITQLVPTLEESQPETNTTIERDATVQEFFSALALRAPDQLTRALTGEFFFGIHTVDEQSPILIARVSSYERAFAGMLEWERSMNADLSPIFTGVPALIRKPDGSLSERVFKDVVMRNFDARVLEDDAREIQLYYSFPSREILIIAESPYSFPEILSRLRAERKI